MCIIRCMYCACVGGGWSCEFSAALVLAVFAQLSAHHCCTRCLLHDKVLLVYTHIYIHQQDECCKPHPLDHTP